MLVLKDMNATFPEAKTIDDIIIKQYLPIEDKLALIGGVVNSSVDDNAYYNPTRLEIFYVIYMIKNYTDMDILDMDVLVAYDKLVGTGLWYRIKEQIPESERNFIYQNIVQVIANIYAYKNSVEGMLESMAAQSDNLKIDAEKIRESLGDSENLKFLKDVVDKLG